MTDQIERCENHCMSAVPPGSLESNELHGLPGVGDQAIADVRPPEWREVVVPFLAEHAPAQPSPAQPSAVCR